MPEGDPATHRRKRYVDATGRALALLGVLFVVAYTVYVLWPDRPQWVTTAIVVILVATWVIFVIDVVIRIALTPRGRRWHYAWHHPLEVLSALLPVFRALRVVGLLQDLPLLKRHTPSAVRAQFIILALAYACAWVFFLALATLQAERDAPGANIVTFGDCHLVGDRHDHDRGLRRPVPGDAARPVLRGAAHGRRHRDRRHGVGDDHLRTSTSGSPGSGTRADALAAPSLGTGEEPDPTETHALPPDDDASPDDDPIDADGAHPRREPPGSLSG